MLCFWRTDALPGCERKLRMNSSPLSTAVLGFSIGVMPDVMHVGPQCVSDDSASTLVCAEALSDNEIWATHIDGPRLRVQSADVDRAGRSPSRICFWLGRGGARSRVTRRTTFRSLKAQTGGKRSSLGHGPINTKPFLIGQRGTAFAQARWIQKRAVS